MADEWVEQSNRRTRALAGRFSRAGIVAAASLAAHEFDMPTPTQIADKFNHADAHDDTVEGFQFHAATKPGGESKVEVTLSRHWLGTRRLLTFTDCRNVELIVDSDVLRDNAPNNAAVLQASADLDEMQALMRRHRRSWNVSYDKRIDPMPAKLAAASDSVLFRVRLFGGVLVVVARSFKLAKLKPSTTLIA